MKLDDKQHLAIQVKKFKVELVLIFEMKCFNSNSKKIYHLQLNRDLKCKQDDIFLISYKMLRNQNPAI